MHRGYQDGALRIEGVDLGEVAAAFGTPCYVYSRAAIEARWHSYDQAFGTRAHRVCYAVKANDNLSILRLLHRLGSSFDIVSAGELERVLAAGAASAGVVFSGVAKSQVEIAQAIASGVACINVESAAELARIADCARDARRRAPIAIRVNPDVDAETHPYIATGLKENKFGVPLAQAHELYASAADHPWLQPLGIACHIGSQLTSVAPIQEAVGEVVALAEALRADGIELEHIDVGGGLGIPYRDESIPAIGELVAALCAAIPSTYTVVVEPGRSIVGEAGVLLTRVEYTKHTAARNFAIVDAGMNDLIRPALYEAWHEVLPVVQADAGSDGVSYDVVGPICETGDWLARGRSLHAPPGALLAIMDAGAYGFVMASNYNARPRAAEVMIDGAGYKLIRHRETIAELIANEKGHLID